MDKRNKNILGISKEWSKSSKTFWYVALGIVLLVSVSAAIGAPTAIKSTQVYSELGNFTQVFINTAKSSSRELEVGGSANITGAVYTGSTLDVTGAITGASFTSTGTVEGGTLTENGVGVCLVDGSTQFSDDVTIQGGLTADFLNMSNGNLSVNSDTELLLNGVSYELRANSDGPSFTSASLTMNGTDADLIIAQDGSNDRSNNVQYESASAVWTTRANGDNWELRDENNSVRVIRVETGADADSLVIENYGDIQVTNLNLTGTDRDLTIGKDGSQDRSNNVVLKSNNNEWWIRANGDKLEFRDTTNGNVIMRLQAGANALSVSVDSNSFVSFSGSNYTSGTDGYACFDTNGQIVKRTSPCI